jgi:excisionase family DNA binding protein
VSGHQPPDRSQLAAPVSGFAAYAISRLLDETLPARMVNLQKLVEAGKLHPDRLRELRTAWAAIRAASREWTQWRTAVDDTAADLVTAAPGDSQLEIDTARAADLLGVSPNRVRQLARGGVLGGRRVGRTWLVSRTDCELRRSA